MKYVLAYLVALQLLAVQCLATTELTITAFSKVVSPTGELYFKVAPKLPTAYRIRPSSDRDLFIFDTATKTWLHKDVNWSRLPVLENEIRLKVVGQPTPSQLVNQVSFKLLAKDTPERGMLQTKPLTFVANQKALTYFQKLIYTKPKASSQNQPVYRLLKPLTGEAVTTKPYMLWLAISIFLLAAAGGHRFG